MKEIGCYLSVGFLTTLVVCFLDDDEDGTLSVFAGLFWPLTFSLIVSAVFAFVFFTPFYLAFLVATWAKHKKPAKQEGK